MKDVSGENDHNRDRPIEISKKKCMKPMYVKCNMASWRDRVKVGRRLSLRKEVVSNSRAQFHHARLLDAETTDSKVSDSSLRQAVGPAQLVLVANVWSIAVRSSMTSELNHKPHRSILEPHFFNNRFRSKHNGHINQIYRSAAAIPRRLIGRRNTYQRRKAHRFLRSGIEGGQQIYMSTDSSSLVNCQMAHRHGTIGHHSDTSATASRYTSSSKDKRT
jgi:hypothetical protein